MGGTPEAVRLGEREARRPTFEVQQQHLVAAGAQERGGDVERLLGADVPVPAHAEPVDVGDAVAGVGDVQEGVLGGVGGEGRADEDGQGVGRLVDGPLERQARLDRLRARRRTAPSGLAGQERAHTCLTSVAQTARPSRV